MKSRLDRKVKRENHFYPIVTIGVVEDVSDAFQMGRMKVRCKSWNDADTDVEDLPFVQMCSPFFGYNTDAARGVNGDVSNGPVAYGQWTVPKVGSKVLVTTVDGDQNRRIWLGSVPDMFYSHTLPHGRYLEDRIPLSSTESRIEPLATNNLEAFAGDIESAEYATRAMDRQVSASPPGMIGTRIFSSNEDDEQQQTITNPDGTTIDRTQGYVDGNSSIYSTTTPGFHSISMDDDPNNCRVRFRTTSGHQVILDDTNERIYVSTAKGKTWIEIDEKGTIDIYGEQDISISSDADVNITAKEKIRMAAGTGIHMTSGTDVRMTAATDMHIKTVADLKIHSDNLKIETDTDMLVKVTGTHDEVSGKVIVLSESTYDLTVTDKYSTQSDSHDVTVASGFTTSTGTYDLAVSGAYTMSSNAYDFDGTNINVKGDIFATGTVHSVAGLTTDANVIAAGSMSAGLTITAGGGISAGAGGMSSTGSISTAGILSSSADVVAGGVSLLSHVHMVPLPQHAAGTIPSPPPVPSAASLPVVPTTVVPPVGLASSATPAPTTPPAVATAGPVEELPAYFPSRVPQHEQFTRSYLKKDSTDKDTTGDTTFDLFDAIKNDIDSVLEYEATNPSAGTGSSSRGKDFARNSKWRR